MICTYYIVPAGYTAGSIRSTVDRQIVSCPTCTWAFPAREESRHRRGEETLIYIFSGSYICMYVPMRRGSALTLQPNPTNTRLLGINNVQHARRPRWTLSRALIGNRLITHRTVLQKTARSTRVIIMYHITGGIVVPHHTGDNRTDSHR